MRNPPSLLLDSSFVLSCTRPRLSHCIFSANRRRGQERYYSLARYVAHYVDRAPRRTQGPAPGPPLSPPLSPPLNPAAPEPCSLRLSRHLTSTPCRSRQQPLRSPSPSGPSGLPANTRFPLQSGITSSLYLAPLVAVAVAVVVTLVLYEAVVPNQLPIQQGKSTNGGETTDNQLLYTDSPEHLRDMEPLPGRPGNLTPEQDEKLRKFWEVFLQVCGVIGDDDSAEASEPAADQGKAKPGSEKGKKKRHMLFKRKDKKDKDGATPEKASSSAAASAVASLFSDAPKADESGDKWGESKIYQEVLAKHTPDEIRSTIWSMVKHDHPDALLLRFLRARKWNVQRALLMLLSTMNWRASEAHVDDDIMYNGEGLAAEQEKSSDEATRRKGADFLAQMRRGISYIHGIDKSGRIICVCKAALHRAGELSEESLERYTVYLIESSRLMLKPPADTAVRCPFFYPSSTYIHGNYCQAEY